MHNTRIRLLARAAWWGLPWLALLIISASAAYGMTVGVSGAEPVAIISPPINSAPCEPGSNWMLRNAVANGWVPDASAGDCHDLSSG